MCWSNISRTKPRRDVRSACNGAFGAATSLVTAITSMKSKPYLVNSDTPVSTNVTRGHRRWLRRRSYWRGRGREFQPILHIDPPVADHDNLVVEEQPIRLAEYDEGRSGTVHAPFVLATAWRLGRPFEVILGTRPPFPGRGLHHLFIIVHLWCLLLMSINGTKVLGTAVFPTLHA